MVAYLKYAKSTYLKIRNKKYSFCSKFELLKRQFYMLRFRKIAKKLIKSGVHCHKNFISGKLSLCKEITRCHKNAHENDSLMSNFNEMPITLNALNRHIVAKGTDNYGIESFNKL